MKGNYEGVLYTVLLLIIYVAPLILRRFRKDGGDDVEAEDAPPAKTQIDLLKILERERRASAPEQGLPLRRERPPARRPAPPPAPARTPAPARSVALAAPENLRAPEAEALLQPRRRRAPHPLAKHLIWREVLGQPLGLRPRRLPIHR